MRRTIAGVAVVLPICALAAGDADAQVCPVQPVTLSDTGASIDGATIVLTGGSLLGAPGSTNRAMVWDEPIAIRHPDGSRCTVDDKVSVVTAPVFDAGGRVLYVTTFSGSRSVLYGVATDDCSVVWKSPSFEGNVAWSGGKLSLGSNLSVAIGPDCRPQSRPGR